MTRAPAHKNDNANHVAQKIELVVSQQVDELSESSSGVRRTSVVGGGGREMAAQAGTGVEGRRRRSCA